MSMYSAYESVLYTIQLLMKTPMIPPDEMPETRTVPLTEFPKSNHEDHTYPPRHSVDSTTSSNATPSDSAVAAPNEHREESTSPYMIWEVEPTPQIAAANDFQKQD